MDVGKISKIFHQGIPQIRLAVSCIIAWVSSTNCFPFYTLANIAQNLHKICTIEGGEKWYVPLKLCVPNNDFISLSVHHFWSTYILGNIPIYECPTKCMFFFCHTSFSIWFQWYFIFLRRIQNFTHMKSFASGMVDILSYRALLPYS